MAADSVAGSTTVVASYPTELLDKRGDPDMPAYAKGLAKFTATSSQGMLPDNVRERVGKSTYQVGNSWTRKMPPLVRNLFGTWFKDLSYLATQIQILPAETQEKLAPVVTGYMVDKSGLQSGASKTTDAKPYRQFDASKLTAEDIIHAGIRVKNTRANPPRARATIVDTTTIAQLRAYEKQGDLEILGIADQLFEFFNPDAQLSAVVKNINSIQYETGLAQGRGYQPSVVPDDNGARRIGDAPVKAFLSESLRRGRVNQEFDRLARVTLDSADAAGGGMDLSNIAWAGTLGGEIVSRPVQALLEGGGTVLIQARTEAEAKLSSALIVKRMANEVAGGYNAADGAIVHGGKLFYAAGDVLTPEVAATVREFKKNEAADAKLYFGAAAYVGGKGRELLLEIGQHFNIMELANDGTIVGAFRQQSPARSGKEITPDIVDRIKHTPVSIMSRVINFVTGGWLRSDNLKEVQDASGDTRFIEDGTAKFQGLSYGLAQQFKEWAVTTERAAGIDSRIYDLGMNATKGLMTPDVKAASRFSPALKAPIVPPASNGSMMTLPLMAQMKGVSQDERVVLDWGVQANPFSLNSLFLEAFVMGKYMPKPVVNLLKAFGWPWMKSAPAERSVTPPRNSGPSGPSGSRRETSDAGTSANASVIDLDAVRTPRAQSGVEERRQGSGSRGHHAHPQALHTAAAPIKATSALLRSVGR